MIIVSNPTAQTLEAGQSLIFAVLRQTGCSEALRPNTSNIYLKPNGMYHLQFNANVSSAAAGALTLSLAVNGDTLPETTSTTTIAAANDVGNVSGSTAIATCSSFPISGYYVTLTNTGANAVTIAAGSASVKISRRG